MQKVLSCLRVLLLAIAAGALFTSSVLADIEYELTDIGAGTAIKTINNSGQVAGFLGGGTSYVPVYWDSISGLVGLPSTGKGIAEGINDQGYVVGTIWSGSTRYGVYWDQDRQMHYLPSGSPSIAFAINNSNQVAGASLTPYAVTWDINNNTVQGLGVSNSSRATDINNSDQIVGYNNGGSFLFDHGTIRYLDSLVGLPHAEGINNKTQVVGGDTGSGAFLWENGVMNYLGSIGGWTYAFGINESTQVVGRDYSMARAFIWDEINGMRDLNDLIDPDLVVAGWVLDYAYDINDSGHIVGYGYLNGTQHGFLLDPIEAPVVPEPATLSLLGLGLLGLFFRRKRV